MKLAEKWPKSKDVGTKIDNLRKKANMSHFKIGSKVRVLASYPPGHVRTPFFIRGKSGIVHDILGMYRNPETLAYGRVDADKKYLLRVLFKQKNLWQSYNGSDHDSIILDLYEHWLESIEIHI